MIDDEVMSILIDMLYAPALYSQVMLDQLDWRLVLLERNLNNLKSLPKMIENIIGWSFSRILFNFPVVDFKVK